MSNKYVSSIEMRLISNQSWQIFPFDNSQVAVKSSLGFVSSDNMFVTDLTLPILIKTKTQLFGKVSQQRISGVLSKAVDLLSDSSMIIRDLIIHKIIY